MGSNGMDLSEEIAYSRVRVFGRLICESALHVGDGGVLPLEDRDGIKKAREGHGDYNGDYDSVCIAANGKPYLPGSTLRGFLREAARRTDEAKGHPGQPLTRRFFGFAEKTATGGKAQYGTVRVYDAFLSASPNHATVPGYWSAVRGTNIRHGIAIDPITGTAEEHKLFSYEYLAPGSVLTVELEGDDFTDAELAQLLGLLACWDGSAAAGIGKGTSKCQGSLKWCLSRVEVLDVASLERWLVEDQPLRKYFRVLQSPPAPNGAVRLGLQSARLYIAALSPLLVNDASYVTGQEGEPDHEWSRLPDGRPMIPAASLRGLIRARARRLLATIAVGLGIAPQAAGTKVDGLVQSLFGKTGARSPLWVSDAVGSGQAQPHLQMFNAIDRFTGGVEGKKLYQAHGIIASLLVADVHLEDEEKRKLRGNWWKGLLILVLRDAMEGDLAVGWGKARGYGAIKVALEWNGSRVEDWAEFLAYLKTANLQSLVQSWIDALHVEVAKFTREGGQQPGPHAAHR